MFKESIELSFTLTLNSWKTDRKTVDTGNEYQLDIGSTSEIKSPKDLIAVHETQARSGPANKAKAMQILIFVLLGSISSRSRCTIS